MNDDRMVSVPTHSPLAVRTGVLTKFHPGTQTLEAGFRITPQFRPLPVDVVSEKDVPVLLRDGVMIHVDVVRPVGTEPVPVIVTWSPYGKGQGASPA
ncbi:CocE/NonD family hydrolase [Umezawaea sp. Da 62-37]|uniref:CocE/NonD family hydrolase n=1 Tax=Umezawaea sp. Da 62-37 TaxID=3075927 RepID=UPI0028F741B0|nr:CocE/NonD family hydrolase [Umezawaea sp. Da 62-37]WNV82986.1 CocE/NonD family hydrolase [Umezawaea sp. Da 62-37]